jgi:hypothetical protein
MQQFGLWLLSPGEKWLSFGDCAQNSLATLRGTRMHASGKAESTSAARRALAVVTRTPCS